MQYDGSAIICLAPDLSDSARDLHQKRVNLDEGNKSVKHTGSATQIGDKLGFLDDPFAPPPKRTITLQGVPIGKLDAKFTGKNCRLIIMGHGSNNAKYIHIGQKPRVDMTVDQLAGHINTWLGGKKIKRISLHMCFGAGIREGGASEEDGQQYDEIKPQDSFAFHLAKKVSHLTEEISARTDLVRTVVEDKKIMRKVGPKHKLRHQEEGDKLVFYTQGNNQDPKIMKTWKDGKERKSSDY